MSRFRNVRVLIALSLVLSASGLAQVQIAKAPSTCEFAAGPGAPSGSACDQPANVVTKDGPMDESASNPAPGNVVEAGPAIYTPSLNGGPPIIVRQMAHLRYLYGLSTSQGFDSAAAGPFRDVPTWMSSYDGYGAASWQFTRSYVVLQQASAFTHYGSSELKGQSFHRTALLATGEFSPRWGWNLEARNSIGDDQLRLISPLPQRTIGSLAVPEAESAVLGSTTGLIWGTDVGGSLTFTPDEKNNFTVHLRNAYHSLFAANTHDNISTLRLEYGRQYSERLSYGVYGQSIRQTGDVLCSSSGGGVQASIKVTESSLFEAAGGPEIGSGGCRRQQGFNLHVAAMDSLNGTTRAYVMLNREFSSGYISTGTWEDNAVAGLEKRLSRRITWDANVGYLKGTVLGRLTSYHGFFVATELRKRLTRTFTAVGTYRRFDQTVSSAPVRRNVVLFTLLWTPTRHDAQRTAEYPVFTPSPISGNDHEE